MAKNMYPVSNKLKIKLRERWLFMLYCKKCTKTYDHRCVKCKHWVQIVSDGKIK